DDLAAHGIRLADDGRFEHRRMFDERALHLERTNPVAGTLDHVIGAADEPVITIRVARRPVPRQVPITAEPGGVLRRIAPILAEEAQRPLRPDPHGHFAFAAGW